eukprot:15362405-Ditylum_brightwellii.AAC.1
MALHMEKITSQSCSAPYSAKWRSHPSISHRITKDGFYNRKDVGIGLPDIAVAPSGADGVLKSICTQQQNRHGSIMRTSPCNRVCERDKLPKSCKYSRHQNNNQYIPNQRRATYNWVLQFQKQSSMSNG